RDAAYARALRVRAPIWMFSSPPEISSHTLFVGSSVSRVWETYASFTVSPTRSVPASTFSSPVMSRKSVVLPAPFRPMTPPLPRRLLLFLVGEALPLLLEPRAVVALVRDAGPLVELEDPAGHVVEEVAVMGDRHHAAGVLGKVTLEPSDRIGVQMVRRLVE